MCNTKFRVSSRIKIGNRLAITVDGDSSHIKNGDMLVDENGLIFKIISIGMVSYTETDRIRNKAELLLDGDVSKLGNILIK